MIIDVHVHCFPEELAEKTVPFLAKRAGVTPHLPGTISALKSSMQNSGISCSVLQNIATKPGQTETINTWAAEKQQQSSEIISFGTIHPEYKNIDEELQRIKALGLKGVKFHPDYQKFYVDTKESLLLYEKIFKLGLVILIHAGIDIGLPAPYHCTPERLEKVVDNFENEKMIAAHMGGYQFWSQVKEKLVGRGLYFDTSYSFDFMPEEEFTEMIKDHGSDKILFGTDSPWADQAAEVNKIKQLKLSEAEKKNILAANAVKLLNM